MATAEALLSSSSSPAREATSSATNQPRQLDRLALTATVILTALLTCDWIQNAWPDTFDYSGPFGDCLDIAYFTALTMSVVALLKNNSREARLNVVAVLFIVNLKHFMLAVENLLDHFVTF